MTQNFLNSYRINSREFPCELRDEVFKPTSMSDTKEVQQTNTWWVYDHRIKVLPHWNFKENKLSFIQNHTTHTTTILPTQENLHTQLEFQQQHHCHFSQFSTPYQTPITLPLTLTPTSYIVLDPNFICNNSSNLTLNFTLTYHSSFLKSTTVPIPIDKTPSLPNNSALQFNTNTTQQNHSLTQFHNTSLICTHHSQQFH